MAIEDDLFQEIQTALGAALTPNISSASNAWDLFEAYVLTTVVDAARRQGAQVTYEDVHGNTPTVIYFRTSPGNLFSRAHDYCHAVVDFQNPGIPPLEIHLGVYVSGKSGITHECDVAVLDRAEAQVCRRSNVHPRHSSVVLSCECKFYTSGLGVDLARGFLGLVTEIASTSRFFVTNTTGNSVEKVLSHHGKRWAHDVEPGKPDVDQLRFIIEEAFQYYKAKHS